MANKKKKVTQATRRKISRASKLYQKVRKTVSKELEKQEKPLKGKDLTAFIKEKKRLGAIFLTQTGQKNEKIHGIITAWDLPKISQK